MQNELTASQYVSQEIRAEMARQSVSMSEMARRIGMSVSSFRRAANGDRPLSVGELFQVGQALSVSPLSFLPNESGMQDSSAT